MYKPGVGGILVECRNLDGDMMDGVRGVRVVGYVDKDGKLKLKIKKRSNQYLCLLFEFTVMKTGSKVLLIREEGREKKYSCYNCFCLC